MLPIEAFWEDYRWRVTGGEPVWWGERKSGEAAQTVLNVVEQQADPDVTRFSRLVVEIACFHPRRAVAETRAMTAFTAYDVMKGHSSLTAGLTLPGNWRAEQVQAAALGITDALPITGGWLYKAVVQVTLVNVSWSGTAPAAEPGFIQGEKITVCTPV